MVVNVGYGNIMEVFWELVDQSIDSEVQFFVKKYVFCVLGDVIEGYEVELCDIIGIKFGQNYFVDLELVVFGLWIVEDMWDVENVVCIMVGVKVCGVCRVRV